jgi:glycosyltransferase involved in cell wall biosynthesis
VTDTVDLILPCLNEAPALAWLLARVPAGVTVILADNGSSDGSPDIAADLGARVVHVPERGFGAAAHAGLLAASAPVVAWMDADGSFDPAELGRVVDPVRAGDVDLMLGRRRPTSPDVWPWHARAGNAVVTARLRRSAGIGIRDLGPMRSGRRSALLDLDLRDRRFGYPLEMIVAAARAGWRIAETDVTYAPRWAGTHSKVTGTVVGTARTIIDMSAVLAR